jgi:hypothetical protein
MAAMAIVIAQGSIDNAAAPHSTDRSGAAMAALGALAPAFVENRGQADRRILYYAAGPRYAFHDTGSASFAVGTSIRLSVSNGREAVWSGACSSGGNRRRTCTFTTSGNASVTASVR